MVKVTIYIEGGIMIPLDNDASMTADNSAVFREGFYTLFSKRLSPEKFELSIQPIGSVNQAPKHLKKITADNLNAILLIDLDGPKDEKQKRVSDNFSNMDMSKLFFMIQEMEALIISQPDKIEDYYISEGLQCKKNGMKDNQLISDKHPEDIETPASKLDTILSQHFDEEKFRKGKRKLSPKRYSKSKDGPVLIGILDVEEL